MRDLRSAAGQFRSSAAATYHSTDSVLKALIGFVIERGVLVTLIQTVFLLMFYLSSSHPYWYVNSDMWVRGAVDVIVISIEQARTPR